MTDQSPPSMQRSAAPLFVLARPLSVLAVWSLLACSDGTPAQSAAASGSGGSGGSAGATGSVAGAAGDFGAASAGTAAQTVGSAGVAGASDDTGGSAGEVSDDDALIVPQSLTVSARADANSVFNVIALTLQQGASGAELYAAARNDGTTLACNASFSVELFDKNQQSLANTISGLMMQHFYQLNDGSGTVAACAAPGDVTMVEITGLSLDNPIADVAEVVYSSSYWILDAAPITGLSVSNVNTVASGSGVSYTGTLMNGLAVALSNPSVTIFPLTHVGRPLGAASESGTSDVAAGGTWDFATSSVSEVGAVSYAAFPSGGS